MNAIEQKKLKTIDRNARRYSVARGTLATRHAKFMRALQALQEKHLPKIKTALDTAANVKSELEQSLADAPELFRDPRTLTLHGVRVGYMDGKPSVKVPKKAKERDAVVQAIRDNFTPEAITTLNLIERVTVDVPNAEGILQHLTAAGSRIAIPGVEFTPAGERVFIKPADHALDKVIAKLLQEGLQKGAAGEAGSESETEERDAA